MLQLVIKVESISASAWAKSSAQLLIMLFVAAAFGESEGAAASGDGLSGGMDARGICGTG